MTKRENIRIKHTSNIHSGFRPPVQLTRTHTLTLPPSLIYTYIDTHTYYYLLTPSPPGTFSQSSRCFPGAASAPPATPDRRCSSLSLWRSLSPVLGVHTWGCVRASCDLRSLLFLAIHRVRPGFTYCSYIHVYTHYLLGSGLASLG